jgi:Zn-dependent protease
VVAVDASGVREVVTDQRNGRLLASQSRRAFVDALIAFLIVVLICLPIHEFGHAWAAVKMGDTLPLVQGRYTLNPKRHLDVIGTLLLALVGFGWAKPVQINPYAMRLAPNPRAGLIVAAAAGPAMNVLLAVIAAILFRVNLSTLRLPLAADVLWLLTYINMGLVVFNLIPIPPLDGSRILYMLLPARYANITATLNQYGPFILLAVVLLAGTFITSMTLALTRFLLGI